MSHLTGSDKSGRILQIIKFITGKAITSLDNIEKKIINDVENWIVESDNCNLNFQNKDGEYDDEVLDNQRFNVSSINNPNTLSTDANQEYFIKYLKKNDKVDMHWEPVLKGVGGIEGQGRHVYQNLDFNTALQTRGLSSATNISTHIENIYNMNKEWISLNASVSNVGLHQATWNTNQAYYTSDNVLTPIISNTLYIRSVNETYDNLKYLVKYIDNNQTLQIAKKNKNETIKNVFKVVSAEICGPNTQTQTVNRGNIEFYFKDSNINPTNSIQFLTVTLNNNTNQFNYNCEYLNNQYTNCNFTNQYYNRNLDILSRNAGDDKHPVEFQDTGHTGVNTNDNNSGELYNHVKTYYENNFGLFNDLFNDDGTSVSFELEGGKGRKAEVEINKVTGQDKLNFKISNSGYLYEENDILRIKDFRLKDILIFTVNSNNGLVDNTSISSTTEFLQEFIYSGQGKSNTIKYPLIKTESLLIKELSIYGSLKSDIIVRLIQIKNIFGETIGDNFGSNPQQYVLKEFYYYKRDNINEKHELNILINNNFNGKKIGNEIFVDIQKIVKDNNDADRSDTLNFTLNAIKFTDT